MTTDNTNDTVQQRKCVLSLLVQNQPGVLSHIAGMFAARAYNIDSLVVGRTEDPQFSRMVLVTSGDESDARTDPQATGQDRDDRKGPRPDGAALH